MEYSMETLCLMWLSAAGEMTAKGREALLEKFGNAENAFSKFSEKVRPLIGPKAYEALKKAKEDGLLAIPRALIGFDAAVLTQKSPSYPGRLQPLDNPPGVLYVQGTLPEGPAVAVVGSRHDTRYGRETAFKIARDLSSAGVTVVSGLARGIDTAAHRGALAGGGRTVAVLGGGFNDVYPPENKDLARQIVLDGGALVTEYPPDAAPLPYHFPLRNRIISGLSDGVLLIEAALKSGTMSTVNHALNQGKPVFALPGNVDAPGSELPLKLLKEGANLCTCAADILDALDIPACETEKSERNEPASEDDPILSALFREEKTFEELLGETGLSPGDLSARLSLLELDGKIEKRAGRAYAKA